MRGFILWLIPLFVVLGMAGAPAQDTKPAPRDGDAFKELLCRMAIGNVESGVQSKRDLFVDLYGHPDGTWQTESSYGLLTGFYYGPRGSSRHGPTLDDPKSPRYLADGTHWTNGDAAHLRALTAEFRQGACDEIMPPPEPEPES